MTTDAPKRILTVLPIALATVALLGLRGVHGFYLPPVASFALGIAALGATTVGRRFHSDHDQTVVREIGLGLAIVACGACLIAAVATGYA